MNLKLPKTMNRATLFVSVAVIATKNMVVNANCPSCSSTSDCTTLDGLFDFIKCKMPRADDEVYTVPSADLLEDWEQIVGDIMDGNCANLPQSLIDEGYTLGTLTEASKTYCILATFQDQDNNDIIDSPLGTVIVNQTPDPSSEIKDISIDIVHPLNDANTGEQGIAIFKGTNARSLVLSGGHRKTNAADSCQGATYKIADAAHNDQHAFQASAMAVMAHYESLSLDYTAIQFHGMGPSSCSNDDVFLTHGTNVIPQANEKIQLLRDSFQSVVDNNNIPLSGDVSMTGDSNCDKKGTSNTQGRLINGVDADHVCGRAADGYSGRFIHIEQKYDIRGSGFHQSWIDAINAVDFTTASPPRSFTITSHNGGETVGLGTENIDITWDSEGVSAADNIKLSIHENDEDKTWVRNIVESTPNTGSYTWPEVSGYTAIGNNMLIRVRSVSETNLKDYSDNPLTIINPIQVVYPNGGETVPKTSTLQVQWEATGITEVKLSLHRGAGYSYYKTIRSTIGGEVGSYTWTIPDSVTAGSEYSIRVRATNEVSVKTYSSSFFTITNN